MCLCIQIIFIYLLLFTAWGELNPPISYGSICFAPGGGVWN
uniref:Uncharacterized protein n=1 Tax=Rhizophora mucronata TaxID=61149 RepID=A0A2P2MYG2_RHIMU